MDHHALRLFSVALSSAILVAACGHGGEAPTAPTGTGTVTGLVTAADNTTPIPQALVTLLGNPPGGPSAMTDLTGAYILRSVPAGNQTLVAKSGVFEAHVSVAVQAGQTAAAPKAALKSTGKLGFVWGYFDNIQSIVRDQLGNPMDSLDASQLGTASVTAQYQIIFLNCGLDVTYAQDAATVANLRAFMQDGGMIYASDFAIDYVQALFPSVIVGTVQSGDEQIITAAVTDAGVAAFVGKATLSIAYNLAAWKAIDDVAANIPVLLRGSYTINAGSATVQNKPLAFVITQGRGRLVYTTFHNEAAPTQDQIAVLRHFIYLQ